MASVQRLSPSSEAAPAAAASPRSLSFLRSTLDFRSYVRASCGDEAQMEMRS